MDSQYVIKKMQQLSSVHREIRLPDLHSFRKGKQDVWDTSVTTGCVHAHPMTNAIASALVVSATSNPWILQQLLEFKAVPNDITETLIRDKFWADVVMFVYDFSSNQNLAQCSYQYNGNACC